MKYPESLILWHNLFEKADIVALWEAANEKPGERIKTIDETVEMLKKKYPKRFRKDEMKPARTRV